MSPQDRARFDALLEESLENLPPKLHALLEEVPLVVDDHPEPALARELYDELGHDESETLAEFTQGLCGLHSGVPLTEQSVTRSGDLPTSIRIFREGIVHMAGGWDVAPDEDPQEVEDTVYEEIMITLLHEIGHHFGLSEADLERLGYD